jgi:hypothetical protein
VLLALYVIIRLSRRENRVWRGGNTGGCHDDDTSLPTVIDLGRRQVSTLDHLATIPEEEIWLQKQKSARTRRAYRLDVQHFMRTLAITTPAELRQADHKAVIAWERYMRGRPSTPRPRRSAGG